MKLKLIRWEYPLVRFVLLNGAGVNCGDITVKVEDVPALREAWRGDIDWSRLDLCAYEQWCVKSNLKTIEEGADPQEIVATLRNNGYHNTALAVELELNKRGVNKGSPFLPPHRRRLVPS